MSFADDDPAPTPPPRPHAVAVIALLAGVSLIFSYLAAYGLMNALVSYEVFPRWSAGHDPRPKILVGGFVVLMGTLLGIGALARTMSRRQLRSIDAMDES
ncbi:MAG: hypothetical protein ACREJC_23230 [Tepidisphaeraceae bacterium]